MPDESMKSYYAQRAREYERIYAKPERQADLRQLESHIGILFTGRNVLEIACGTGYWTQFAANSARSITATDINPEVIAIAKSKSYGKQPIFLIADAYAPTTIPGEFNALLAAFWWSHIPKERLDEFLSALHQRLAPGSLIAFLDNRYVEGSSTPISSTDASGNTYQDRRLDDGSIHHVLKNFPSISEIEAALVGRSTNLEILELQYYWLATYTTA